MKRFRDTVRFPKIAVGIALFVGGLLGVHLLLPYVVNTQGVRQLITSRAAAAYSGEIEFSKFKPGLLPMPHVRISQGRLTDGDRIELQIPDAAVYLRVLPLLFGKIRIDRIKVINPSWLVDIGKMDALASADSGSYPPQPRKVETLSPFIGFLRSAEAEIINGRVDLRHNGRPMVILSKLNSRITTAERHLLLHLNGITNLDNGFTLDADIDLQNLYSHGQIKVTGLQSQVLQATGFGGDIEDVFQTAVDLGIDFHVDGAERIRATFEAKTPKIQLRHGERQEILGGTTMKGHLNWSPQNVDVTLTHLKMASPAMKWSGFFAWTKTPTMARPPIEISLTGVDMEISPLRDLLLNLWGDQPTVAQVLDIVRDGRIPSIDLRVEAPDGQALKKMRQLQIEAVLTKGRIVVPDNLFDLEQVSGRVMIAGGRLSANGISARLGKASASNGELSMGLYDGSRAFFLDMLIDTDISEIPKAIRQLDPGREVRIQLDQLPQMTGRASGRLTVGDHLDRLTAGITAQARINTDHSDIDLIGTISGINGNLPSTRMFAKGRVGSEVLKWLGGVADIPSKIALKAPFAVTGAEIDVAPAGRIRFNGSLQWDDGARIGAAVTVSEEDVHLQQLRIQDTVSDARITIRNRGSGRLVEAHFAGVLDTSSFDRMVDNHHLGSGAVQGRFRIHFHRDQLERSIMDGELLLRDLKILPDNGEEMHVIEAAITGDGRRFDLLGVRMQWGDGRISLAGGGLVSSKAVDVKGTIQADTLHTQQILTLLGQKSTPTSQGESTATEPMVSLRGKVKVEVDQLVHGRYRFDPMHAWVEFKERQTLIDITSARLCGIQMPGQIRFADNMANLAFSPQAKALMLQDTGRCLLDSQNSEKLMGTLDLGGAFRTEGGDRASLLANLKGEVEFSIEEGRISNVGSAGFFTNVLSYLSVNQYVKGDLPDLRKDDFSFNRMESKWVFDDGIMRIDEGVLRSNSVNMVADGRYDLLSGELDMVVLVSPLTTVDWIVERIPILGNILQGTLVAIPVRVRGPETDPAVVPLSPKAVGKRLGGILKRTIKTPVRIIEPLLKDGAEQLPEDDEN